MFIGDKNCIECTVDFKIKGDNSVNDTQIRKIESSRCNISYIQIFGFD